MRKFSSIALVGMMALTSCSQKPTTEICLEIKDNWQFSQAGKNEWLAASVPGSVHTDLIQNKKIEDPYYRLNEHDVQWIDKVDWEYKTSFIVSEDILKRDRIALDFKGLDTYADVFVNDQQVLSADNMFREWTVDIKKTIKSGNNDLRILFRSPIVEGLKKYNAYDYVIPVSPNDLAEIGQVEGGKMVSVYTRKAGYHFGWDWGPRLVTSGIWRPVYLRAWDSAKINDLQIVQNSVTKESAEMTANFEIEAEENMTADLTVENEGQMLASQTVNLEKGVKSYAVNFTIANPKLWWTNGLGEQPLYTIKGRVTVNNNESTASERIGIRTLKLVRNQDEKGTTFYFELNGVPVFMKGANYIPNDIFPARVTEENYRKVINTAKTTNQNMLRVWGGGIYESDLFYDLCDEAGILVWQDFMFACAMFPNDQSFLDNIRQEAIDNVKRLRNHPSIAMWCGNNEILAAWLDWGWKADEEKKSPENAAKIWKSYQDIFHVVLPEVVSQYDGQRSYWDSSPSSGTGIKADLVNGDEHYWGVWWGKEPFSNYATHLARFMSEYGFQSFPELKTVKAYALPKDFDINSEVMKSHQRSSIGNGTIAEYIKRDYKDPKDFESFLYVGQVLQAEGIKFAMESHRRAMPYNMGSLYWQINDCWPVASWSSTDYYQRWKALQYFVKKAFEPVIISPYGLKDTLNIGVVSDRLQPFIATIKLKVIDFGGKVVWNEEMTKEIPANSASFKLSYLKNELLKGANPSGSLLVAEIYEGDKLLHSHTFYFNPVKDLNLPKPEVRTEITEVANGYNIVLSSEVLAKNVYLSIDDQTETFFTDNYFDLLPGEKVTIECRTNGAKIADFSKKLKIMTIADSF
jgi:beta-mannosidase